MADDHPTKRCPKCGTTKPQAEFCRNRAHRDGLNTYCKLCVTERERVRRMARPPRRYLVPVEARPLRTTWEGMHARCYKPNHLAFANYGGRGIAVCERWKDNFRAFYVDILASIGPRPSSAYTLDRIDNDGNYEPGNVRWATWTEQARNKSSNRNIEASGRSMTVNAWAEVTGLKESTIRERLRRGWSPEEAIFKPVESGGRR